MSEIKKCIKCSFRAPIDEWATSLRGKKFSLCVKCREYHNVFCKDRPEYKLRNLESKNLRYRTDEVYRNAALSYYARKEVLYIICDYCGKDMRQSSLRAHLICCQRKISPALEMLKKLNELL